MPEEVDETNGSQVRGPKEQPLLNLPGIITASLALIFGVQILLELAYYLAPQSGIDNFIYFYGGFIAARYSSVGGMADMSGLWTPLTYSFLHGGWEHLIFNALWLAIFGSPVARRIGRWRFCALWVVTSTIAAFVFYFLNMDSTNLLVGASGVISGLTGAACRFVWSPKMSGGMVGAAGNGPLLSVTQALSNRAVLSFVVVWFVANVLLAAVGSNATAMAIAWEAHLGGFLAGFLLFPLFDRPNNR